jgi:hypothetical protein
VAQKSLPGAKRVTPLLKRLLGYGLNERVPNLGVERDKLAAFAARLSLSAEIHSVHVSDAIEFCELHCLGLSIIQAASHCSMDIDTASTKELDRLFDARISGPLSGKSSVVCKPISFRDN